MRQMEHVLPSYAELPKAKSCKYYFLRDTGNERYRRGVPLSIKSHLNSYQKPKHARKPLSKGIAG